MLRNDELTELKGHFLASLNHEIRTPLSGILGMTDLLLETPLSEDQKDYVGATRLCAESLLEILNVTLEYSALSANHIHLEEAEFSLRDTLKGVISEFSFKAEAKGLRLKCNVDRNFPDAVVGDALRLRQLLWHLLGNAIKFTQTGDVEVSASATKGSDDSNKIRIEVKDTGIGIAPEKLDSIFESFRQLETGLARNYPGLGLGLAVAQKLAMLLGGEILVSSEVGLGSTFTIQVPLRSTPEVAARSTARKQTRGHILVVDDNTVAQTIASHLLRRNGYEVECAGDGPTSIRVALQTHFDVILMDLQMPGMDGFETARHIREFPEYAESPIIAVTANCSSDYRDLCMSSGFQGFLPKPVQSKELILAVEKYLAAEQVPQTAA